MASLTPHRRATLQALLVTFLWATSWVLIKIGLKGIPALTFAGLRYSLAFLCLLPFFLRSAYLQELRRLSRRQWLGLVGLGVVFYAVAQGAQFVSLSALPSVTVNLMLSLSSIIVAVLGSILLRERPRAAQWVGIGLSLAGAVLFFYPIEIPAAQVIGWVAAVIGLLATSFGSILGRSANRDGQLSPLLVTFVSMGIGSALLLFMGILTQGMPPLSPLNIVIVVWLAVVNTAFAFTLWNRTLRLLSAAESTVINNSMLIQIPILAVLFLGETLSVKQLAGMLLNVIGIFLVQWRWTRCKNP